ncbi:MAG TPA: hypothetical protein VMR75_03910, partial [Candidatus Saccharimonadales bacterium]|nr:hypothetical protein [Candidatus Saccharimonadales bacterium]
MSVAIDGLRRDLGQLDLREAAPSVLPPWPAKKKYVAAGGIVVDYPADLTMHRVAHGVAAQASSLPLPAQPLQRPLNWRRWLMISLGAAALLVSGWGATHLARSANLLAAHAAVATPTTSAAKTTAKPAPAASPTAQQLQAVV